MKILGIVCEYNPFHTGHAYQIQKAREESGADIIVCAMSGPLVQRGDLAIIDKWERARCAVLLGADVVFELPALFALRAAPDFAYGAVSLLKSAGASCLSFGCETDSKDKIMEFAALSPDMKDALKKGQSYPRAFAESSVFDMDTANTPNLVLASEYLKASQALGGMELYPIKRTNAHLEGAGAIRKRLLSGEALDDSFDIPACTYDALSGGIYNSSENISQAALFKLRNMPPSDIALCLGVSEGLENRIYECAQKATSLSELFSMIKTKRYTMARIRRAVLSCVLDMTYELAGNYPAPPYLRLLAFNAKTAGRYLRQLSDDSPLPVISKLADANLNECLSLDIYAQSLFDLGINKNAQRDYLTSPVIIK